MTATPTDLDRILALRQQEEENREGMVERTVKLVIVSLGDHWFAFPGEKIREVLADCPVYFLPGCPPSLEGVINVRGDISSVIRLRSLLDLPDPAADAPSRILLGQTDAMCSGIRVDRVEEVLDIRESDIHDPPHTIPEHLRSLVLGIISFRDHLVHLLDLDRLFTDYRAGLR